MSALSDFFKGDWGNIGHDIAADPVAKYAVPALGIADLGLATGGFGLLGNRRHQRTTGPGREACEVDEKTQQHTHHQTAHEPQPGRRGLLASPARSCGALFGEIVRHSMALDRGTSAPGAGAFMQV